MNFNLQISNQSEILEDRFKASLYKQWHQASQKSKWVLLSGLPLGIISGISTIAKRVALIAEAIIKGAANILGSTFSPKCFFITGLGQLMLQVPKHIIILPFSFMSAGIGLITKTAYMAIDPAEYTGQRWLAHDPAEKDRLAREAQERDRQVRSDAFQMAQNTIKNNPRDVQSLKYLALCYREGTIVQQDHQQALNYYIDAGNCGDVDSMVACANYIYPQDRTLGLKWYQEAAKKGDLESMVMLGVHYEIAGQYDQALQYFKVPAERNNPRAMQRIGVMLAMGHGVNKNLNEAVLWLRRASNLDDTLSMSYLHGILLQRKELQLHLTEGVDWWLKASKKQDFNHSTHVKILIAMNKAASS